MKTLILAAACALLAPVVGRAQLVLGAQAAVGLPQGDLEGEVALGDEAARAFPVELRAAWRVTPAIALGLQGGWGYVSAGDARDAFCASTGVDCSAHLWRLAARAEYGFAGEKYLPFLAATLGWQWLVERWETSEDNWDQTRWGGWLLGLEAGIELPLGRRFRGGLFAGAALGQFLTVAEEGETGGFAHEDAGAVRDPAASVWLGLGLRVTYGS